MPPPSMLPKVLRVPTYLSIVCDTGSVGGKPGSVASRALKYEVLDQMRNFNSSVEIREELTILPGGASTCTIGTKFEGGRCVGAWSSHQGYFVDQLAVGAGMATLDYWQTFSFRTLPDSEGDVVQNTSGSLYVINNYVGFGPTGNHLSVSAQSVYINGDSAGRNDKRCDYN